MTGPLPVLGTGCTSTGTREVLGGSRRGDPRLDSSQLPTARPGLQRRLYQRLGSEEEGSLGDPRPGSSQLRDCEVYCREAGVFIHEGRTCNLFCTRHAGRSQQERGCGISGGSAAIRRSCGMSVCRSAAARLCLH